jgi:hypothetical protein
MASPTATDGNKCLLLRAVYCGILGKTEPGGVLSLSGVQPHHHWAAPIEKQSHLYAFRARRITQSRFAYCATCLPEKARPTMDASHHQKSCGHSMNGRY